MRILLKFVRLFLYRTLTILMAIATIIIGGQIAFSTKVNQKRLAEMETLTANVSIIPASMSAVYSNAVYVEYIYNGKDYAGSVFCDHPVTDEDTITIKVDPEEPEFICTESGKRIKTFKEYAIGGLIILAIILAESVLIRLLSKALGGRHDDILEQLEDRDAARLQNTYPESSHMEENTYYHNSDDRTYYSQQDDNSYTRQSEDNPYYTNLD